MHHHGDFDRGEDVINTGAGDHPDHLSNTVNKVKLPEIAYGVSHSTEMPDGVQKQLNKTMNNYNSDPYALRLN